MTPFGLTRFFRTAIRDFRRDRSGASAIEFAFIVPLLLVMYLGTIELGQGIETNKKVARSAAMIGDLVAQEKTLTKSQIDAILVVGDSVIQPYYRSNPTITITAIQFDGATNPVGKVLWSRKITNGVTDVGAAKNTVVTNTVPTDLRIQNSFYIGVSTQLDYYPLITGGNQAATDSLKSVGYKSAFTKLPMREVYFFAPRTGAGSVVSCSDC